MADIIQVRRDTAANWTSVNPTLAQGEFAVETDTNQFKIGDGATAWTSLTYVTQGPAATIAVGTTTTGAEGTNASVVNSGNTAAAVFDFTIPRGDTGAQGPQGIQGPAGTPGNLWSLNGLTAEYLAGGATVGGVLTATGGSSTDWNTAYGWGDHSVAGYATTTNFTSTGIDDNATSTAITIDSSENVGIGTTPSAWRSTESVIQLPDGVFYSGNNYSAVGQNYYIPVSGGAIYEESNFATDYYQTAGTHVWRTAASGTAGASISWSEAMRIDSSGNVGIGTSSPIVPLQVVSTTSPRIFLGTDGSNFGGLVYSSGVMNMRGQGNATSAVVSADGTNSKVTFTTAGVADRMVIDSSGDVGINITNPTEKLHVGGNILATGNITAYSDERLKSDVQTLDGTKVFDMRGTSYIKDGELSSGVIAQELQKVAPELVHEGGEYLSVAYGNLVGYLIEAVKHLNERVKELEDGVTDKRPDKP